MTSKFIEAIEEVTTSYPEISSREVEMLIVEEIEKSLPRIISSMKLPPQESPLRIMSERAKIKRMKKKFRKLKEEELSRKFSLLNYLHFIQQSLNGKEIHTDSFYKLPVLESANLAVESPAEAPPVGLGYYIGAREEKTIDTFVPLPGFVASLDLKSPPTKLESIASTYRFYRYKGEPPRITISPEIKLISRRDRILREAISVIKTEISINRYLVATECSIDLLRRQDIEIPSWKRFIVRFVLPHLTFDEKMEIWRALDEEIRESVLELKSKFHGRVNAKRIDWFNRNLFTEMEL